MNIKNLALFLGLFVLSACAGRKIFEPTEPVGVFKLKDDSIKQISFSGRNGALLEDGQILSSDGISKINLSQNSIKQGANFISQSGGYYIFTRSCKNIMIADETDVNKQKSFPVATCIISASISGNLLAYVLSDNSFGLIDINSGSVLFSDKGVEASTINSLQAKPLFIKSRVIFPLLDGKLVFVKDMKLEKEVIVGFDRFFSNIIFLDILPNADVVAATANKLSILGSQKYNFETNIQDVIIDGERIYVLNLDGRVIELDREAKITRELKFQNAVLAAPVVVNGKLNMIERAGFLIEIDLKSFSHKIYEIQNKFGKKIPNKKVFYTKDRIFYDYYEIDFAK